MDELFATSRDGTRVFLRSFGAPERGPALLLCDGFACAGYIWRRLLPVLEDAHPIVHLNYRGHGRSEPPPAGRPITMDDLVDDSLAALDAAGAQRAVLVGHSMGVQVILECYRRAPERVAGLVGICGAPGRPLDTLPGRHLARALIAGLRRATVVARSPLQRTLSALVRSPLAPAYAARAQFDPRLMALADFEPFLAHLAAMDLPVFLELVGRIADHDARDLLPAIDVPTLIVGGRKDQMTPAWLSEQMHAAIPEAELLLLDAGGHCAPLELPELIAARILSFIEDRVGADTAQSSKSA